MNIKYDALYLCSALVLPEFRKRGLAKKIALDAIFKIRKDHPKKPYLLGVLVRKE